MAQQGDSDTGDSKPRDDDVITAIESGDFKTALSLVESFNADKSLKFTYPNSLTPLYLECHKQAIVNRETTPLHIAAHYGHLGLFQYLLDLIFTNIPSAPPLSQDETLRRKQELILNLKDNYDNTPLHVAGRDSSLDILKLLTGTLGCDPNCTNRNGMTCLHLAAVNDHIHVIRYLIETCSDLALIDDYGRCLSYLAAGRGHLNILRYMIEDGGSDPHFKIIIKKGKWMTVTPGRSLVHVATEGGHLHVIRYLIGDSRCNPSGQDDDGITPLHLACQRGYMDIVKYLITEANCDLNIVSKDGMTCLHLGSKWGRLDVVEYLTSKHQCISKRDIEGNTPLHYATERDVIKFLTKNFICDLLETNNKGETALDRASNLELREESYLREASTNLTAIIPPTINISVVGNSGSGKSTL